MSMKLVIVIFLLVIVYALGSGLFFLVKDKSHTDRVVKALTWRISLSLVLFVLLLIAYAMGWIVPHNI